MQKFSKVGAKYKIIWSLHGLHKKFNFERARFGREFYYKYQWTHAKMKLYILDFRGVVEDPKREAAGIQLP